MVKRKCGRCKSTWFSSESGVMWICEKCGNVMLQSLNENPNKEGYENVILQMPNMRRYFQV